MKFCKFIKKYHIEEVTSTSSILYENISKISNLTFLSTDYQTNGKGRSNHIWESSKGENLLFSFVIKDKKLIKEFKILSISLASMIAKYLISLKIKDVSIKWPNDVYVKDKKICGILLEGKFDEFIIVGIGVNINQKEFGELNATSLSIELETPININRVKKEIYKEIKRDLGFVKYFPRFLLEYAKERNYLLNKEVDYEFNNKKYHGVVRDIDSDASLVIKSGEEIIKIDSGEVLLSRRENGD